MEIIKGIIEGNLDKVSKQILDSNSIYVVTDMPNNSITNAQMNDAISSSDIRSFYELNDTFVCLDEGTYTKNHIYKFLGLSWKDITAELLSPYDEYLETLQESVNDKLPLSGGTLTDKVTIESATNAMFVAKNTSTNKEIWFGLDSTGTVKGLYDYDLEEWLVSITNNVITTGNTKSRLDLIGSEDVIKYNDKQLAFNAEVVHKTDDESIAGRKTFLDDVFIGTEAASKDLYINGHIYQQGSSYITHAEEIYTTNDYIHLRSNAQSGLPAGSYAGFEFKKYDGTNNGRLVVDNQGTARVGDAGDEQPIATRSESEDLEDGQVMTWSAAQNKLTGSSDYVKNTDYANSSVGGVIKVNSSSGLTVDSIGVLSTDPASKEQIMLRLGPNKPITSSLLDYAVKLALTSNRLTGDVADAWTEEDKAKARDLLGATGKNTSESVIEMPVDENDVFTIYEKPAGVYLIKGGSYYASVNNSKKIINDTLVNVSIASNGCYYMIGTYYLLEDPFIIFAYADAPETSDSVFYTNNLSHLVQENRTNTFSSTNQFLAQPLLKTSHITTDHTPLPIGSGDDSDKIPNTHWVQEELKTATSSSVQVGDIIQNQNPFSGKVLYNSIIDDALYSADKRFWVTITLHNKVVEGVSYPINIDNGDGTWTFTDSPIEQTIPGIQALFNNAYEDSITIPADKYAKIHIQFSEDGTDFFKQCPYGTFLLNYYYPSSTESPSHYRCYNTYEAQGIGWKFQEATFKQSGSYQYEEIIDMNNYQRTKIEFIVFGKDDNVGLNEVSWFLNRPNDKDISVLTKFTDQSFYTKMSFVDKLDAENKTEINQGAVSAKVINEGGVPLSEKYATKSEVSNITGKVIWRRW